MENKFEVSVLQRADIINQKKKELDIVYEELLKVELYQRYLQLKEEIEVAEKNLVAEEDRVIDFLRSQKLNEIVVNDYEYKLKDTSRPSVYIEDESLVPKEFLRVKTEVDKNAILNLYKEAGVLTPGTNIVKNPKFKLTVKKLKWSKI